MEGIWATCDLPFALLEHSIASGDLMLPSSNSSKEVFLQQPLSSLPVYYRRRGLGSGHGWRPRICGKGDSAAVALDTHLGQEEDHQNESGQRRTRQRRRRSHGWKNSSSSDSDAGKRHQLGTNIKLDTATAFGRRSRNKIKSWLIS